QAEHAEPDEEAIRRAARAEAERGRERVALRRGQVLAMPQRRPAELVQARERELHLGLDAGRADDPAVGRLPGEMVEGHGLADARVAADHERAAMPLAHVGEQLVQPGALLAPAQQSVRPTLAHARRPTLMNSGQRVNRLYVQLALRVER